MDRLDDDFVVVFERLTGGRTVRMLKVVVKARDGEEAISSCRTELNLEREQWKVSRVGQAIVTQAFAKPDQQ